MISFPRGGGAVDSYAKKNSTTFFNLGGGDITYDRLILITFYVHHREKNMLFLVENKSKLHGFGKKIIRMSSYWNRKSNNCHAGPNSGTKHQS